MQQGMSNKHGERNTLVHSGVVVGYHVENGKRNANDWAGAHLYLVPSPTHTHTIPLSISLLCGMCLPALVIEHGSNFLLQAIQFPTKKNDRSLSACCVRV